MRGAPLPAGIDIQSRKYGIEDDPRPLCIIRVIPLVFSLRIMA